MKTMLRRTFLLCFLCALTLAARGADLTVFAAASLSDALTELGKAYQARSGDRVRFNFGASSLLARQLKEGAPADLFVSADEAKMDDLAKADLIDEGTRRNLLSNTLVVVVNGQGGAPIMKADDLALNAVRKLALGETETVPAGIYAREYLQKAGLWKKVRAKVVSTENVRAALAAVENGNAEAAIVYRTDALISKKVKIAFEVPASEAPQILYPLAVMKAARRPENARAFAEFLSSPEAWTVFARFGFLPAK